jgi:hypothetical protein
MRWTNVLDDDGTRTSSPEYLSTNDVRRTFDTHQIKEIPNGGCTPKARIVREREKVEVINRWFVRRVDLLFLYYWYTLVFIDSSAAHKVCAHTAVPIPRVALRRTLMRR